MENSENPVKRARPEANGSYLVALVLAFVASGLIWYGLVAAQVGARTPTSSWLHRLRVYKELAAAKQKTPKIILLGASGTFYGIRSQTMTTELGMPVVNMGLTADLGIRYIVERSKPSLRPGDTVLLTIEYGLLTEAPLSPYGLDYVYSRDPGYIGTLPPWEEVVLPMRMSPFRLAVGLASSVMSFDVAEGAIARDVGPLGDGTYRQPQKTSADTAAVNKRLSFSASGPDARRIGEVAEFADWCRRHRIRLVLSYPALSRHPDLETADAREFLRKVVQAYAHVGVQVMGSPGSFVYDASWFKDSRYHLTLEKADVSTRQRAGMLKALLSHDTAGPTQ